MGVKLNGRDLADLGIGMTSISGWSDGPDEHRNAHQFAGPFGQVETGIQETAPRRL